MNFSDEEFECQKPFINPPSNQKDETVLQLTDQKETGKLILLKWCWQLHMKSNISILEFIIKMGRFVFGLVHELMQIKSFIFVYKLTLTSKITKFEKSSWIEVYFLAQKFELCHYIDHPICQTEKSLESKLHY